MSGTKNYSTTIANPATTPEKITITFIDMNNEPPTRHPIETIVPTEEMILEQLEKGLHANPNSGAEDDSLPLNLLTLAHANDLDLEGACGGELACSTCHCIFKQDTYDKILNVANQEMSEEEEDMLDLAWGLTETSRLGCQIKICKELDGMEVIIPKEEF